MRAIDRCQATGFSAAYRTALRCLFFVRAITQVLFVAIRREERRPYSSAYMARRTDFDIF